MTAPEPEGLRAAVEALAEAWADEWRMAPYAWFGRELDAVLTAYPLAASEADRATAGERAEEHGCNVEDDFGRILTCRQCATPPAADTPDATASEQP